jgi:hypothetical protein
MIFKSRTIARERNSASAAPGGFQAGRMSKNTVIMGSKQA